MSQDQPTLGSLSNDFLKYFSYAFTYFPVTNWQRFFNPTINIGCSNLEDAPVEQHVVDKVGSYGYQLNRILDVLGILVADLDKKNLTPQEQAFVFEFKKLAEAADQAAAEYLGETPHGVTHSAVDKMIDGLRSMQRSDPVAYEQLVAKLREAFDERKADIAKAGG